MILTVEVAQDRHIDPGSTNMCTRCPIARALVEAVGLDKPEDEWSRYWDIEVQPGSLRALGPSLIVECDTTDDLRQRILTWDATGTMEPFTFQVEARKRGRGEQLTRHHYAQLFFAIVGAGQPGPA